LGVLKLDKKLLFIINPRSGKGLIKNKVLDIVDLFVKEGYDVHVHTTQARRDAYEIIKEYGSHMSTVVASGGDGTLSECVKGIMEIPKEKRPIMGYIPCGSTNDFAVSLKLSKNMLLAAGDVVYGEQFKCDVGKFNNDFFTYIAAFGAFTDVSYETPQSMKNMLGHLAYTMEAIKRVPNLGSYKMKVEHDGIVIEDEFIYGMISNTTSIGGVKNLGKEKVQLDDGLFEVILIRMPKNPIDVQVILTSILMQDFSGKYFYTFKASEATFSSDEEVKWTLDGEDGGKHKTVVIENYCQAITMMISSKKQRLNENVPLHSIYNAFKIK
jgi:YegS/Rv2252/BmrU family lipid kinase